MTNEQQIIFENNKTTYKVLFLQSQQVGICFAAFGSSNRRFGGLRKTTVGCALGARTLFVPFFSATFFCTYKNAPHFSLSGAKKTSFTARTLCAILPKIDRQIGRVLYFIIYLLTINNYMI